MKLIIDIPKGTYEAVKVETINQVLEYKVWNAIKNGTPFDSVIEDIKAELTKDYVDDNPDNFRYTTVMLKDVLAIIDMYISGKENE